jgi:hypothetical protein
MTRTKNETVPPCRAGGRPPCPICPVRTDCAWGWEVLTDEADNLRQAGRVIRELAQEPVTARRRRIP